MNKSIIILLILVALSWAKTSETPQSLAISGPDSLVQFTVNDGDTILYIYNDDLLRPAKVRIINKYVVQLFIIKQDPFRPWRKFTSKIPLNIPLGRLTCYAVNPKLTNNQLSIIQLKGVSYEYADGIAKERFK